MSKNSKQKIKKIVSEEVQKVIKEDNVLVKLLNGILSKMQAGAKRRAIKKFLNTKEMQDLMSSDSPAADKYQSGYEKMLKKYS